MASIKLISRRIKSAQNISQITKAMEMVAASKMKKAQEIAVAGKPYTEKIYQATRELANKIGEKRHPLLSPGSPAGRILVVLISTNKGLCGGLNTNLFRLISRWIATNKNNFDFITIGKKGENFIVRHGNNLLADFSDKIPFTSSVPAVNELMIKGFIDGRYKEVYLAFNSFLSPLKQVALNKQILPISGLEKGENEEKFAEFLLEPSVSDILGSLLPHYLENQVRAAILEADASEHSARMIAMKNATDAAFDLIDGLTLIYNKARQEKITYEIADMVVARLAVE